MASDFWLGSKAHYWGMFAVDYLLSLSEINSLTSMTHFLITSCTVQFRGSTRQRINAGRDSLSFFYGHHLHPCLACLWRVTRESFICMRKPERISAGAPAIMHLAGAVQRC